MSPASIVTRTQRLRTTHQNLGFFYSVLLLEHHFSLHRCFLVKHFLEAPRVHRHFCAISTCCHGEGKILGKYWKWIWVIREVREVLGRYVREIKGTISLVVWCWKLCKFCTRTKPRWNPGLLHLHLQWCQSWFFVPFRQDNTVQPGCSFPSESTTFLLGNFKEKKSAENADTAYLLLQGMHKLLNTLLVWSFKSHWSSFLPELSDMQRAARRTGLFPDLGAIFLCLHVS